MFIAHKCNLLSNFFHVLNISSDCGEPAPAVANGNFYGNTFYNGTANVTCSHGYDGDGPAICRSDGNWATVPTCIPKGK